MRRDVREKTPTAADIAEVASGKGSPSDKREVGFVKRGGRLVPSRGSPRRLQIKFGSRNRQTKQRTVRARGRSRNQ